MSSFKENLAKCTVKVAEATNDSTSRFLFGHKDWWGRLIIIHPESPVLLCAERYVTNENGFDSLERHIIADELELKNVFKAAGYWFVKRECNVWKDSDGQHGIIFTHTTSKKSYCVSGRKAMALAKSDWHMFENNDASKTYDDYSLEKLKIDPPEEPEWHGSLEDMLEEAIADMLVPSVDHPVAQTLIKRQQLRSPPKKINISSKTSGTPIRSNAQTSLDELIGDED